MATGRIGMGLIITVMIMAPTILEDTGGRMVMCSDITITAGSIMVLAGAGLTAAVPGVDFMEGEFRVAADLPTVAAAATEEEAMADDGQFAEILCI